MNFMMKLVKCNNERVLYPALSAGDAYVVAQKVWIISTRIYAAHSSLLVFYLHFFYCIFNYLEPLVACFAFCCNVLVLFGQSFAVFEGLPGSVVNIFLLGIEQLNNGVTIDVHSMMTNVQRMCHLCVVLGYFQNFIGWKAWGKHSNGSHSHQAAVAHWCGALLGGSSLGNVKVTIK